MATPKAHSLIVSGNVYFFDFRKSVLCPTKPTVQTHIAPQDARVMAETLQGACRDLIADAPALVRYSELNAADLVSVASMIDELAFQAHLMALESRNFTAPGIGAEEMQQLLLEGAAVTAEIQSCMSAAYATADQLARRLREQAEQALRLGRGIAQALDAAADQTPGAS